MVTKAKLKWLSSNLSRGDKKLIHQSLLEQNPDLSYMQVAAILLGRYYGIYGEVVIMAAEKLINARNRQLARQAKKYASKGKASFLEMKGNKVSKYFK